MVKLTIDVKKLLFLKVLVLVVSSVCLLAISLVFSYDYFFGFDILGFNLSLGFSGLLFCIGIFELAWALALVSRFRGRV